MVSGRTWLAGVLIISVSGLAAPTWLVAPPAPYASRGPTIVLLSDGRVFLIGGRNGQSATAFYEPLSHRWAAGPPSGLVRSSSTATLLKSGAVLTVGGDGANASRHVELWSPSTNQWAVLSNSPRSRIGSASNLLFDGGVLLHSGAAQVSADLFTGAGWVTSGAVTTGGTSVTSSLLLDGTVAAIGGYLGTVTMYAATLDLYNPATNTWVNGPPMARVRINHTSTVLVNGEVLVASGTSNPGGVISNCDLYDPVANSWRPVAPVSARREDHVAVRLPDGRVLVAGGNSGSAAHRSSEIFNPTSALWVDGGATNFEHDQGAAALLFDGRVLLVAGMGDAGTPQDVAEVLTVFTTLERSAATALLAARSGLVATALATGELLVTGGSSGAELYAGDASAVVAVGSPSIGRVSGASLSLLFDGRVLLAGGTDGSSPLSSTELYDPVARVFSPGPALQNPRTGHRATVLPDGTVLLCGGKGTAGLTATCDRLDPSTGAVTATGPMGRARAEHQQLLLGNGLVLAMGGNDSVGTTATCELYNPSTGTWAPTGSMPGQRERFAAVMLQSGEVLVSGGTEATVAVATAVVYEPRAGVWSAVGALNIARSDHAALALPNGHVLVAGGLGGSSLDSIEMFEPVSRTWATVGTLGAPRTGFTLMLLPDDSVVAMGGSPATQAVDRLRDQGGRTFAFRPTATFAPRLRINQTTTVTGLGLMGLGEAHGGNGSSAPSNFPLVLLRGLESGLTSFAPTSNWTNTQTQAFVTVRQPGWYQARVIVSASHSESQVVFVAPSACVTDSECGAEMCLTGSCAPRVDAGTPDAGASDAGELDAGLSDAGSPDGGPGDAGAGDGGADAGPARHERLAIPGVVGVGCDCSATGFELWGLTMLFAVLRRRSTV